MTLDADLIVDRRRMRRKLTFWRAVAVIVAFVIDGIHGPMPDGSAFLDSPDPIGLSTMFTFLSLVTDPAALATKASAYLPAAWIADPARLPVLAASALLVLAGLARCRAGVVCAVYAQRNAGQFVTGAQQEAAESACVETGLDSLRILAEMDRQKRAAGTDRWRPSLWT